MMTQFQLLKSDASYNAVVLPRSKTSLCSETRFYCPQAFLSLDFHCRTTMSVKIKTF